MKLSDPVTTIPMVGMAYAKKLEKLDIHNIKDLLWHIPSRYNDFRVAKDIGALTVGETVSIKGEVVSAISQYTKKGRQMQIVRIQDETGAIEAIWFNQKFLLSTLKTGTTVVISGEVNWFSRKKAFMSPEHEVIRNNSSHKSVHTGRLVPVYPETAGVSSKWLRSRINAVFPLIQDELTDYFDKDLLKDNKLISLSQALSSVHFPDNPERVEDGKHRLAFDELFFLQIASLTRKREWENTMEAHALNIDKKFVTEFTKTLPFTLTKSQQRSVNEVLEDMKREYPMNRLLEGDVGSGKTVVAAAACFVAFKNGLESVVMAPTQILATQHFLTLDEILSPLGVSVNLITSAGVKKKTKTDIYVGTHALIHNRIDFENVAIVVVDEQHKFGVEQRAHLVAKTEKRDKSPDVLTMTATPIPRTVALAAYGDLDLSTLDTLPSGRKPVTTWLVPPIKRAGSYKWIEKQIENDKIQVFVVCPFIEESENEKLTQVKAVKTQYKVIKKYFPKRKVGLLHGKLKSKEKDEVLEKFKQGKTDILVSTPVIEVGIDIPNATIMMIEGADRFGLAQLHQLRGRVGRGSQKSYCLLLTENTSAHITERLSALKKAKTGFALAELDLRLRGPGEIFGTKQSGFPELKIASWTDEKLIRKTKNLAVDVIDNPDRHNSLVNYLKTKQKIEN